MKRDVLILCQYFYPEYVSSATLPFEMAEEFVNVGLSVDVLCGYPKEYTDKTKVPLKEVKNGINIQRVRYLQFDSKKFLTRLMNFFSFLFAMLFKIYKLKKYKNVIVYSNPPLLPIVPALVKRIFKFNLIFVSYDVYPEVADVLGVAKKGSPIYIVTDLANKLLYKNVTKIVALSSEMKHYILDTRKGITEDQVTVIPNWFQDRETFADWNLESNKFRKLQDSGKTVILYSGNMGLAQDMNTILESIIELRDDSNIHFLLVGHGSKMSNIQEKINIHNLQNVEVIDFLHGVEFLDVLKVSSAYLISLEKGLEQLCVPSKTYSYMAVGRPLLAIMSADTDIAKDINSYQIGYQINQGDTKALVHAIQRIDLDKSKAKAMAERCRSVYEANYTHKVCVKKYIDLIREIS